MKTFTTAIASVGRLRLALVVALTIAVVAITAYIGIASTQDAGASPAVGSTASSPVVAGPGNPTFVAPLSGPAADMSYDQARNVLWLVSASPAGGDQITRLDPTTGNLKTWKASGHNLMVGFFTRIRVDQSGATWLVDNYTIFRIDPVSGSMTSLTLPLAVTGADPAALDPDNYEPGTWISGVGTSGSSLVIARNHVPFLTVVGSDLRTKSVIPLPASYSGAYDIAVGPDQSIAVLSRPELQSGQIVGFFSPTGDLQASGRVRARSIQWSGNGILVTAGPESGQTFTPGADGTVTASGGTLAALARAENALAAVDPMGGVMVYADGRTSWLTPLVVPSCPPCRRRAAPPTRPHPLPACPRARRHSPWSSKR